jgi:hypothetical protein
MLNRQRYIVIATGHEFDGLIGLYIIANSVVFYQSIGMILVIYICMMILILYVADELYLEFKDMNMDSILK